MCLLKSLELGNPEISLRLESPLCIEHTLSAVWMCTNIRPCRTMNSVFVISKIFRSGKSFATIFTSERLIPCVNSITRVQRKNQMFEIQNIFVELDLRWCLSLYFLLKGYFCADLSQFDHWQVHGWFPTWLSTCSTNESIESKFFMQEFHKHTNGEFAEFDTWLFSFWLSSFIDSLPVHGVHRPTYGL